MKFEPQESLTDAQNLLLQEITTKFTELREQEGPKLGILYCITGAIQTVMEFESSYHYLVKKTTEEERIIVVKRFVNRVTVKGNV